MTSNLDVLDERVQRIQRRFEGPVLAAALLVIPVEKDEHLSSWDGIY